MNRSKRGHASAINAISLGAFAMVPNTKMVITKLDAGQRQLRTAITLWFNDGDEVSIHALAFAAYEVMHAVSKRLNPLRRELIFDSLVIKDEYRDLFNIQLKKSASFFKHANRATETEIEFDPSISEFFILYAVAGRELCKHPQSAEESAYLWWVQLNQPALLTENGRKFLADRIPANVLDGLRKVPKGQFFNAFLEARKLGTPMGKPRLIID
jgi:hypothetical protein